MGQVAPLDIFQTWACFIISLHCNFNKGFCWFDPLWQQPFGNLLCGLALYQNKNKHADIDNLTRDIGDPGFITRLSYHSQITMHMNGQWTWISTKQVAIAWLNLWISHPLPHSKSHSYRLMDGDPRRALENDNMKLIANFFILIDHNFFRCI